MSTQVSCRRWVITSCDAEPGTPSADKLQLLASWAASTGPAQTTSATETG